MANPMPPGRMRGWVDARAGYPILNSKTSIRVGSGTGLNTQDGADGYIAANGAAAELSTGRRDAPSGPDKMTWYNPSLNLGALFAIVGGVGHQPWNIDLTTGFITQPARSALSATAGMLVGIAGWQTPGTYQSVPDGTIDAMLMFTATAGHVGGYQVGSMNAAHAPATGFITLAWRNIPTGSGLVQSGYINSAGAIVVDATINNGDTLSCYVRYSRA